jgi:hypothetical protein
LPRSRAAGFGRLASNSLFVILAINPYLTDAELSRRPIINSAAMVDWLHTTMAREAIMTDTAKERETTAHMAGTGAGVMAGAQIGTILLPVPIIGTFTGGLIGGIVGSKIGKRFGRAVADKLDSTSRNPYEELERLARLRDQGILSEEEFQAAKAKLFGL